MHWLTQGPRGRRLLWELAQQRSGRLNPFQLTAEDIRIRISESLAQLPDNVSWSEAQLLEAFADSVSWARYWEAPDNVDLALTDAADLLEPLAARLEVPLWWTSPIELDAQVVVTWEGAPAGVIGAVDRLAAWRAATVADEERAALERPADPRASWSGFWWSAPVQSKLLSTVRLTAGLALVEDGLGWASADVQPVSVAAGARVYEVDSPADWIQLVESHPLVVTASRRQDWWRAVGADAPLVIADYQAVSQHWDAVHVSAHGYLTAATRALVTVHGCTVLAGWNPDQTWWLSDVLTYAGPVRKVQTIAGR